MYINITLYPTNTYNYYLPITRVGKVLVVQHENLDFISSTPVNSSARWDVTETDISLGLTG